MNNQLKRLTNCEVFFKYCQNYATDLKNTAVKIATY